MAKRFFQPSLFGELAFIPRRKKVVRSGKQVFHTGNYRKKKQPPLGVVLLGQRAARSKVDRKRRAS